MSVTLPDPKVPGQSPGWLKVANRAGIVLFLAVIAGAAGLATWSNSDLTSGRPFLFMDEMIAFDNVKRILTASDSQQFWWAVLDGADHRYGRIFYNFSALVSWLPYRLAGDPGLIIAIRSTQAALLLGAMALLCISLLRTWTARSLAILAMACLPFTDYYLTMPKPEPLQLAFYALFIAFAVRVRFAFGWHWLFLGLAFGTKISAAPLCALVGVIGLIHGFVLRPGWGRFIRKGIVAAATFLAGWIIAVPILATPTKSNIESYVGWTFRATGHGIDDSRVDFLIWLKSLATGGEVVQSAYPAWLGVAAIAVVGVVLVLSLVHARTRGGLIRELFFNNQGWIVLGMAAAITFPLMFAVKRLWGFYLLPGQVMAIAAQACIAEQLIAAGNHRLMAIWVRRAAVGALVAVTLMMCWFLRKSAWRDYSHLAHRTEQPAYLEGKAAFDSAVAALSALSKETFQETGNPLVVVYDPFLFLPDSRPGLDVRVFWAADVGWKNSPHAVVLGRMWHLSYFLREKPLPPESNAAHRELVAGLEGFEANVEPNPDAVSTKPYQLVQWLGDEAALILRSDLVETWRQLRESDPNAAR